MQQIHINKGIDIIPDTILTGFVQFLGRNPAVYLIKSDAFYPAPMNAFRLDSFPINHSITGINKSQCQWQTVVQWTKALGTSFVCKFMLFYDTSIASTYANYDSV